jgi:hypothetical protein
MYEVRESWDGTRYIRQISGTTLHILLSHNPSQHQFAFYHFTHYLSSFHLPSPPLLLGRGAHSYWRPRGFASHGPRPLHALQIFLPCDRTTFIATTAKHPASRSYIPGEVAVYGGPQGGASGVDELCVCISDDIAIPLEIFTPQDIEVPTHLPWNVFSHSAEGGYILLPLYALIAALQQYSHLQGWISRGHANVVPRLRLLAEDIHDLRYLCYSQARFEGTKLDGGDRRFEGARGWAEGYVRGEFVAMDVETQAGRATALDHFGEIGLIVGAPRGVRYDLPGQKGWSYHYMNMQGRNT